MQSRGKLALITRVSVQHPTPNDTIQQISTFLVRILLWHPQECQNSITLQGVLLVHSALDTPNWYHHNTPVFTVYDHVSAHCEKLGWLTVEGLNINCNESNLSWKQYIRPFYPHATFTPTYANVYHKLKSKVVESTSSEYFSRGILYSS